MTPVPYAPAMGIWSRRRAAVAEEARRDVTAGRACPAAAPVAERADIAGAAVEPDPLDHERSEAETLAALGLPDPDAMGAGDDFAAFMSRAVPAALRRRALRRLWGSRPVLANLDRLVDYDDDYTGGGVPMGSLRTAYTVGRGLLDRAERLAEADAGDAEAPASRDDSRPEPDGTACATTPETRGTDPAPADPTAAPGVAAAPGDVAQPPTDPARRRMRFEFA